MTEMSRDGRLGRAPVARVGFGAMQLDAVAQQPDGRDTAVAVLRRAVELGVDHVDTADFYGEGTVNDLIRTALRPYREDLQLVTKVGARRLADPAPGGVPLVPAQRPEELRDQVQDNLRRLGVERLAVVNLRRLGGGVGLKAEGDQLVPLDDQLAELVRLRDEGLIGGIGLSGVDLADLEQARPAGIVCVQNLYHLLERSDEDVLQACARYDIAYVPFFPLGSAGIRGMRSVLTEPEVVAVAAERDLTPAQVALAWLLARDPHVLLIPGTGSLDHLVENLAADSVRLDVDALRRLDGVAA